MVRLSGVILGIFGILGAALSGGCADLMQRSTIAPEWFQAKAVEVKGEGYPSLKDIPPTRGVNSGGAAAWKSEAASLKAEVEKLESQAAAGGAIPTDEEVRATAAQLRAQLESGDPSNAGKAPQP
jgi:hypothetical protein